MNFFTWCRIPKTIINTLSFQRLFYSWSVGPGCARNDTNTIINNNNTIITVATSRQSEQFEGLLWFIFIILYRLRGYLIQHTNCAIWYHACTRCNFVLLQIVMPHFITNYDKVLLRPATGTTTCKIVKNCNSTRSRFNRFRLRDCFAFWSTTNQAKSQSWTWWECESDSNDNSN